MSDDLVRGVVVISFVLLITGPAMYFGTIRGVRSWEHDNPERPGFSYALRKPGMRWIAPFLIWLFPFLGVLISLVYMSMSVPAFTLLALLAGAVLGLVTWLIVRRASRE
jgi:hypothetical protein